MTNELRELRIEGTIHEALGIEITEATPEVVVTEAPVGPKVHQPFGLLHGGASAVLAESAASIGAYLNCDRATEVAVGVELNISHLKAKASGIVRATATPLRLGRSLQVWAVALTDEAGEAVAVARCTVAVRPRRA
ncbi:MAG: hotdog fold thioesterase [Actinobacteria bacterium]|nr:hotdog fold thioesterase [Actinomycetota bacterium]